MGKERILPAKLWRESVLRRIDKRSDGCWYWTGAHTKFGHGVLKHAGKQLLVHRQVWTFLRGDIPAGLFVLHTCDVPICCNPDHLFLGTQLDNVRDKITKDRHNNGKKLTRSLAKQISIQLRCRDEPLRVIAKDYGIAISTVWSIKHKVIWRNVLCS